MIIADENIDYRIISALRDLPVSVLSIDEDYPGFSDFQIIELSRFPSRIILTEDKDFGEWVFSHKVRGISVIFLRYHYLDTLAIIEILKSLIQTQTDTLFGKFTTVTARKIRTREI